VRVRAILNPRAGLRARRALEALRAERPSWSELEVKLTTGPGDAQLLAREAAERGDPIVLAVGGDGTANEVAEGLLGSETALGLVPMGSGNGLARTLGIPLRPGPALQALEGAVTRRMDVGIVNGRPFLNVAGAGFDAVVGEEFHRHGRRGGRRGVFTYVRLGVRKVFSYQPEAWLVECGNQRFEGRALIVAFVNGRQYGGAAVIAPGARLDDGLLDVVVLEDAPVVELLLNVPRLFLGTIDRCRRYRRMAVAEAVLTGATPVLFHRDGEPEPAVDRIEARVQPRALKVLVPRATADDPAGPFGPE